LLSSLFVRFKALNSTFYFNCPSPTTIITDASVIGKRQGGGVQYEERRKGASIVLVVVLVLES